MKKSYPWNREAVEKFDAETSALEQQLNGAGLEPGTPPLPALPEPPPVAPAPVPATPPVVPPAGPSQAELTAQAELSRLKAQLEEERAVRQAELTKLRDYEAESRRRELEKSLNMEGEEFAGLDPEDAKKILRKAHELVRADQEDLAGQVTELKQTLAEREARSQEAKAEAQRDETNRAILAAFPNFSQLQQDPDFQKFMASPVRPGSPVTNQMDLTQAYNLGQGDYVVASLKAWQSGGASASPENIVQISPSAASPLPEADRNIPAGALSEEEQTELFNQVRSGAITKEQYRDRMAKHKEALKAASKT